MNLNGIWRLLRDGTITKPIIEDIVFHDLDRRGDFVWSFLLFTGYLKAANVKQVEEKLYYDLSIPNREVFYGYKEVIQTWLNNCLLNRETESFLNFLVSGNIEEFAEIFNEFVLQMMSYYDIGEDEPERVYQAFVLGMLVHLSDQYQVKSNKESGYGRYDVMIIPRDFKSKGIVIEFKKFSKLRNESVEDGLARALVQIREKQYSKELRDRGITDIIELAIVFDGKQVWVREQTKADRK